MNEINTAQLKVRWLRLMESLGIRERGEDKVFETLVEKYSEPNRFYHGVGHISDLLDKFDKVGWMAESAKEVELALWFHDAVYDTQAKDNERQSAELARKSLLALGLPGPHIEEVCRLIIATEHKAMPETNDTDAQLVVDLDLSSLASDWPVFQKNTENIRKEYAWVPEPVFSRERARFMRGMLERPSVFSMEIMKEKYESKARENLERSAAELEK